MKIEGKRITKSEIKDRIMECKELPAALRAPLYNLISYGTYDPAAGIVYNIFPTLETVAATSGCSVTTVKKAIKAGVELGFITVTPTYYNGRQSSNHYTINVSALLKKLSVNKPVNNPWKNEFRESPRAPTPPQNGEFRESPRAYNKNNIINIINNKEPEAKNTLCTTIKTIKDNAVSEEEIGQKLEKMAAMGVVEPEVITRLRSEVSYVVRKPKEGMTPRHTYNRAMSLIEQGLWNTPWAMQYNQTIERERAYGEAKQREAMEWVNNPIARSLAASMALRM